MSIKIIFEKDKEKLEEKAGIAFADMIISYKGKPLLVLLSGGSSLKLLDYVTENTLTYGNITFGMLDDRFSQDQNVNTYKILENSAFTRRVMDSGCDFLSSAPDEVDTLETYAEKYESEIKEWLKLYPDGKIIATVGVGPDGHTSGILPFPEDSKKFEKLFNSEKLVVGYDVDPTLPKGRASNKNPHRYRMTSTFTLMRKLDQVLTYMQGESKRESLEKIMDEKNEISLAQAPARILRKLKQVELFTDIKL